MALYAGVDRGFAMPECPGGPAHRAIKHRAERPVPSREALKHYPRLLRPVTVSGDGEYDTFGAMDALPGDSAVVVGKGAGGCSPSKDSYP